MDIHPSHHPHLPDILSWPRTRAGVISALLGLVAVAITLATVFTAKDDSQAGLLQLEAVLMILTAPAALISAVIAAFRDHERSVFVWISIVAASLFLLLMFFELTFPSG
jgi:predicted anti-sigma-YlaC factor YlaD